MDEGVMTWNYTNVYADGQLFATYDAQGLHFQLNDWLGTRRVTTDYAGVVEQTCASLPYGYQLNCTGSLDAPNEQHFTAKTHDTESGLDYFGARYYGSTMGRFLSPDWAGKLEGSEPVPYANLEYPQTLNLYSYAGNNPLSRTDPHGHFWQELNNWLKWGHWVNNAGLEGALQKEADQDRQVIGGLRNISINGKSPADALKGLNNEQTITLDRSVVNFLSQQVMGKPSTMVALALTTDGAGVVEQTCASLPYGDQLNCTGSLDAPNEQHFTGKTHDTESGLDYFGARYYSENDARFMSPDWSAKVEPVPYAKLDNPQSLNLYSYVLNNPLSGVDPNGHADIAAECKGQSTCHKTLTQTVEIVHQHNGRTIVDSTLRITTNFTLTTDAKGHVTTSASSIVQNVSGIKFSSKQLALMGRDLGTMQQDAVTRGLGPNTTQLVSAVGAAESHFGASRPYAGAPSFMDPATNPMQLTGRNGANMNLNHNVEGGLGMLGLAERVGGSNPMNIYHYYSDHSPTTMANWAAIYGSISEQQP